MERAADRPPAAVAALAEYEKKTGRGAGRARARCEKPAAAAVAGFAAATRTHIQREQVAAIEKARPPVDEAMAVEDAKGENLRVHLRGNHLTLGAEAPRRFPRILAGDKPLSLGADRSGRLELAEWLTRPDHPLTARVMVNRIWAGHFGAGLVRIAGQLRPARRAAHAPRTARLARGGVRRATAGRSSTCTG